jgi:hypothetical protein
MEGGSRGGRALGARSAPAQQKKEGKGAREDEERGLMGGATLSASIGKRKSGDAELGCCGRGLMGRWATAG